ncbi:MAG: pyrroline-5-carboxylate reductase [Actinomycetaceae bacterium]|nr:pyrroline-5-carboxylate reductase [Actinomycetaceae bacterium]
MIYGFIGAGNMASAIVRGAVESTDFQARQLLITDRNDDVARRLADEVGASTVASNTDLVKASEVVILAVKPVHLPYLLNEIASDVAERQPLLISIAAGIAIADIQAIVGESVPIIRVMPNMNASIGESMTGVCASPTASQEHLEIARRLMNAVGRTLVIGEGDFPVFSALAGCSPAWMYEIIDSLARAGVKYGLPKSQAVAIVSQAMMGSAQLVLQSAADTQTTPAELIDRVCSPAGTTIAGLLAAQEAGLATALVKAVDAAVARDIELGRPDSSSES